MDVLDSIETCRRSVRDAQRDGRTVGLVPTMGALHEGHRSLIRASKSRCDVTAVTIFVNPTQFGPDEDLATYPRPIERDLSACREDGVDIVFVPTVETIYPEGAQTTVHVGRLTHGLCGALRPGHFDGVTTVVAKLFSILPADVAFFGEKDYQQMVVIRQMVRDLDIPIEIVACPIVREPDGLAMSSRNAYLSQPQRQRAAVLNRALYAARRRIESGDRDVSAAVDEIRQALADSGVSDIDYVEIVDADSLDPLVSVDRAARICLAVRIGPCRLIDNVGVDALAV